MSESATSFTEMSAERSTPQAQVSQFLSQANSFRNKVDEFSASIADEFQRLQSRLDGIHQKLSKNDTIQVQQLHSLVKRNNVPTYFSVDSMQRRINSLSSSLQLIDELTQDSETNERVDLSIVKQKTDYLQDIVPLIESLLTIQTQQGDVPFDPKMNQAKIDNLTQAVNQIKQFKSGTTTMTRVDTNKLTCRQLEYVNKIKLSQPIQVFPDSIPMSSLFAETYQIFENMNALLPIVEKSVNGRATSSKRAKQRVQQAARFNASNMYSLFITPLIFPIDSTEKKRFQLKQLDNGKYTVGAFSADWFRGSNTLSLKKLSRSGGVFDYDINRLTADDIRWRPSAAQVSAYANYSKRQKIRRQKMKKWGLIAFAVAALVTTAVLLYVFRFDLGLASNSSGQDQIVSDEILFTIEHEEALYPRTSLNRLVRVVDRSIRSDDFVEDSNKVLKDTFDSVEFAFAINPDAYSATQIYYGLIYANSNYSTTDPNNFESYYSLIELGTEDTDPLISVKQQDIDAMFQLAKIGLVTVNGVRKILLLRDYEQVGFTVSTNYIYVLKVTGSFNTKNNKSQYTLQMYCHSIPDPTTQEVTQNVFSPVTLNVTINHPLVPICVELPDANYWGEPKKLLEHEAHRKVQLIDPQTQRATTELSSIFKLYDVVIETKQKASSTSATRQSGEPLTQTDTQSLSFRRTPGKSIDPSMIVQNDESIDASNDTRVQPYEPRSSSLPLATLTSFSQNPLFRLFPAPVDHLSATYPQYPNQIALDGPFAKPIEMATEEFMQTFTVWLRGMSLGDFTNRDILVLHNADNSVEYLRLRYGYEYMSVQLYDVNQSKVVYDIPFDQLLVKFSFQNSTVLHNYSDYTLDEPHTLRIFVDFYSIDNVYINQYMHAITLAPSAQNCRQVGSIQSILAVARFLNLSEEPKPTLVYTPSTELVVIAESTDDFKVDPPAQQTTQTDLYFTSSCIVSYTDAMKNAFASIPSQLSLNYSKSLFEHVSFVNHPQYSVQLAPVDGVNSSSSSIDSYCVCYTESPPSTPSSQQTWTRQIVIPNNSILSLFVQHTQPSAYHSDTFYIFESPSTTVSFSQNVSIPSSSHHISSSQLVFFSGVLQLKNQTPKLFIRKGSNPSDPVLLTCDWNSKTVFLLEAKYTEANSIVSLDATLYVIDGIDKRIQSVNAVFPQVTRRPIEWMMRRQRLSSLEITNEEDSESIESLENIPNALRVLSSVKEDSLVQQAMQDNNIDMSFPFLKRIRNTTLTSTQNVSTSQFFSIGSSVSIKLHASDLIDLVSATTVSYQLKANGATNTPVQVMTISRDSSNQYIAQSHNQTFNINQCYFEFVSATTSQGYSLTLRHFSAQGTLLYDRLLVQGATQPTLQWSLVTQNIKQTLPLFYNLLNHSLYDGNILSFEPDQDNYIVKPFDLGDDYEHHAVSVIRRVQNNSIMAVEMPFEMCVRFRESETFSMQLQHNDNNNQPPTTFLVFRRFSNIYKMLLNTEHIQVINQQGSINSINPNNFIYIKLSCLGADIFVIQVREIGQTTKQVVQSFVCQFTCTFDVLSQVNVWYIQSLVVDEPLQLFQ